MNHLAALGTEVKSSTPQLRTDISQVNDCRVCLVRNEEQLRRAVRVRHDAYHRHLPDLAAKLEDPEVHDRLPNSVVLLAESRATSRPLGTVRIHTNLQAPNEFEASLSLPDRYNSSAIAHISRLAVDAGADATTVKLALFKALYKYCEATQIRWMMVGAKPPLDRQYVRLGFEDVFSRQELKLIPSSGGIPVRIMAFEVPSAERRWLAQNHPYYSYIFLSYTPEIEVFSSISGMWNSPRASRLRPVPSNQPIELGLPII